jgi:hypothetical protein
MEADFIPVRQLSELTGTPVKTLYNSHCAQRGPLHEILVKLGGRLGCWRADYIEWRDRQRKLAA